jgi:hypothetical protein
MYRVICHLDMDAFYATVEIELNFVFSGRTDMPTVNQCEIPEPKAQIILQKEAKSRNDAHRECWIFLKCPYAENEAHVAT